MCNLVTINTSTGAVTDIGALPGDTDALAVLHPATPTPTPTPKPLPSTSPTALSKSKAESDAQTNALNLANTYSKSKAKSDAQTEANSSLKAIFARLSASTANTIFMEKT